MIVHGCLARLLLSHRHKCAVDRVVLPSALYIDIYIYIYIYRYIHKRSHQPSQNAQMRIVFVINKSLMTYVYYDIISPD